MLKRKLTFLLALLCCFEMYAQTENYIVEIKPGKKIIHLSEMNVMPTTSISEVLDMFPELLLREGQVELQYYDVQVNDVSTGNSKESVLQQLRVADVKTIEISQSPSASQQRKGQGGVIKIIMNDLQEGFSGSAMVEASTMWDAMPTANLNYRKGNLSVRGSLSMEYYQPKIDNSIHSEYDDNSSVIKVDTNKVKTGYEMARVIVNYMPSEKHDIKFWAWESYEKGLQDQYSNITQDKYTHIESTFLSSNSVTLNTGLEYKYIYGPGTLKFRLQYEYLPNHTYKDINPHAAIGTEDFYNTETRNNTIVAELSNSYHLIKEEPHRKCVLGVGLNASMQPNSYGYRIDTQGGSIFDPQPETFNVSTCSDYLSPFVEIDSEFNKFFLNAGIRYQFYQYNIDRDFSTDRHDYTAFFNFGWQIVPHHHLSLIADRSLKRPDNQQVYPQVTYDIDTKSFVLGNEELESRYIHNIQLNYIYDFTSAGHNLVFNTSLQYINTSNLINTVCIKDETLREYYTFYNDGTSNIVAWNGMLMYNYGIFSMALSANVYGNYETIGGEKDKYFCYNISWCPILHLPLKWAFSAKVVYNSRIEKMDRNLGDYIYSQVRISKEWKRWTFFAELDDNFHKPIDDRYYSGNTRIEDVYVLRRPCFALGFHVSF